ncbi:hypothetical protein JB92DRAFT_3129654 [Gautieria morchelliformis]|nr:hypothetical protein JB92DRAFT_3129654 [Gautieria morchelliformis]
MATSSFSAILERTQTVLKFHPDFQGELREEIEECIGDAEEVQAVRSFVMSRLISPYLVPSQHLSKDPEATQSSAKDLKAPAPVLQPPVVPRRSAMPQVVEPPVRMKRQPMLLSSDEQGDNAPTPKKAKTGDPPQRIPKAAHSSLLEIILDEQPSAPRRKGHANAQVAEADKVPQSVVKQGYPEHMFLLGWKIYIREHEVVMKPAKCGRCLRYGHMCSGLAGKMCGRCIRDRQGCVSPEEYEAKEEKDAREAEVKERGTKGKAKGKAKDKGSMTGPSSISSKGILDTLKGTRMSTLFAKERVEELVEKSEELMRHVSVRLNELNGSVL